MATQLVIVVGVTLIWRKAVAAIHNSYYFKGAVAPSPPVLPPFVCAMVQHKSNFHDAHGKTKDRLLLRHTQVANPFIDGDMDFTSKIIAVMECKSNKQTAGIIGASLSKEHLVGNNNYVKAMYSR